MENYQEMWKVTKKYLSFVNYLWKSYIEWDTEENGETQDREYLTWVLNFTSLAKL